MSLSEELFKKSQQYIPGGVNSPVRAFKSVDMTPPFIKRAYGSKIEDVDGNLYIDYVGSWGPMILGHAKKEVIDAVKEAIELGTSFGAPTQKELELAQLVCEAVPSIEMVRMVNSGTEAVMSAIRLARGYTKRDIIVKFEGCYHGHSDGLLVKAGSGALTTGIPNSAGVPQGYVKNTITAQYNNFEEIEDIFTSFGENIAAVIVEPVAGNMGVVPPKEGYHKHLRELTYKYGSLLIFDEVITGFRLSYGGAQVYYKVTPDITVFGKIIGGGMPVGAYGGKKEIMEMISPLGPVYQAGTLSGNPIAMTAGIATLKILKDNPTIYEELDKKAGFIEEKIIQAAKKYSIPVTVNRVGSLLSVFFTNKEVVDYKSAMNSDVGKFKAYFRKMLECGVYIAPSQFEAMFISDAHNKEDIKVTLEAIDKAFKDLLT